MCQLSALTVLLLSPPWYPSSALTVPHSPHGIRLFLASRNLYFPIVFKAFPQELLRDWQLLKIQCSTTETVNATAAAEEVHGV